MSTPATPDPVPYGGPVSPVDAGTARAPLTPQTVAKGVGKAALWIGIRAVIFLVVKAILKGLAKR